MTTIQDKTGLYLRITKETCSSLDTQCQKQFSEQITPMTQSLENTVETEL
jgi:hypothetical protein